ncbi:MAG: hypothetical protein H7Y27_15440, partial [Gemmatimonadaceae bacterium]|nr:hypothetical protein [Chitinophagaceae bacterium]
AVYAAVEIDERKYFIDGCDRFTPVDITPPSILNTNAFVLNKKTGGLTNVVDNSVYNDSVHVSAFIGKDGLVRGHTHTVSSDYAKLIRLEHFRQDEGKYADKYFRTLPENIAISDFKTANDTVGESALRHDFNFATQVAATGDYIMLPTNLFTTLSKNPFPANTRFADINFGFRQHIFLTLDYAIPDGYSIDVLPKSVRLVTPDRSIDIIRTIKQEGKEKVSCSVEVRWNKSFYHVDEYPEVKAFYKKMFELLGDQIVLKKQVNP